MSFRLHPHLAPLLIGALMLSAPACGDGDTSTGDEAGAPAEADADNASEAQVSSDAEASSMAPEDDATSGPQEDASDVEPPSEDEVAAACSAYCVFDNETCPDPSEDAVNDTAACEAECLDADNPAGLAFAAAKSAACYAETSAYLGCLGELTCEGYDAHLAGLGTPDYVDDCTMLLADGACD